MTATLQSYTTGTVAVTNGSDIVTLTGGAWLESWCVPGSDIRIAGESTAMVIEEWIDTTHVRLTIPIQRTTAAGLTYSILMTSPAFGTNRLGALTAVERIRLMTENVVINQLLGVATGALAAPALQDRIGIWDASDAFNAKPGTLQAALMAGNQVNGKAVDYTVTTDDYGKLLTVSAGTGARTMTLPAVSTAGVGFVIAFKKVDGSANAVNIVRSGTGLIDGATSLALTVQYGTVILRCDGVAWHVVVLENTSSFARTLFDDANAAAVYATLGEVPDTNIPRAISNSIGYDTLTDANTLTTPGWQRFMYRGGVGNGANFPPVDGRYWAIQVIRRDIYIKQIAHQVLAVSPTYPNYERISTDAGSTWSDWKPASGPWLGTVAQVGGVPTGAIIERGSNANGSYIRFADGTQICWQTAGTSDTADTTWTFPAAFSLAPNCNASPTTNASSLLNAFFRNSISATAGSYAGYTTSGRIAMTASLIAIGRWF